MNDKPMDFGWFEYCLNVKNIKESISFYKTLGFEVILEDIESGWGVLKYKNTLRLALYHNHIPENIMNFRGGDVFAIAEELKLRGIEFTSDANLEADSSVGATIKDPDGNIIYFNTHPDKIAPE